MKTDREHRRAVEKIRQQVLGFYRRQQQVKIYHGSSNTTRENKFTDGQYVDVSALNRVLAINETERYALVEPNVPMDQLVEACLGKSLVPPVVMELPGITVGGGIQGAAGESGSHRYGLFHEICTAYEMVLATGEKVIATAEENSDLFYGTVGSYGSLGVMTAIKLSLIPARPYVKLHYLKTLNFADTLSTLKEKVSGKQDLFIDGITFSKERGVVMLGNLSEKQEGVPVSHFHLGRDEWFYLHADKITKKHKVYEELIPIRDYFFRYDIGAFWAGKHGFHFLHLPFNRVTRYILGRAATTRRMFRALHSCNVSQRFMVQDLSLPYAHTEEFLHFITEKLTISPLWLLPIKPEQGYPLSVSPLSTDLVINVGVWGKVPGGAEQCRSVNRQVENKVNRLGGRKCLYAHQYYPSQEFWQIYNEKWYRHLRQKYEADKVFPDIYTKTKVTGTYTERPVNGFLKEVKGAFTRRFIKWFPSRH